MSIKGQTKISVAICGVALTWLSFWYFDKKESNAEIVTVQLDIAELKAIVPEIQKDINEIKESQLRMEEAINKK